MRGIARRYGLQLMGGLASSAFALIAASQAHAQDSQVEEGAEASTSNQIIVTARRVEERLLETPLAVTAFTREQMEARNIDNLTDVALLTPGLSFESYRGGALNTPVIRGATQQSLSGLEQNVSVFLDGIYLPRGYATDIGSEGLERVEVVKGPQGTLYGQNAFMGAINYITRDPGNDFGISALATVGSDHLYEAEAFVSLPVVRDVLSIGVNGSLSRFDGTWRNNHPLADVGIAGPSTDGNAGGWERWNVGVKALLTPTDKLTIEATFRHFDTEHEHTPRYDFTNAVGGFAGFVNSPFTPVNNNCSTGGVRLYCGVIPSVDEDDFAVDPRSRGTHLTTDFYALSAEFQPSDDLSLIYSYGRIETDALQLGTQLEAGLLTPGGSIQFVTGPDGSFRYYQHELRALWDVSANIRLQFGGFLSRNTDFDMLRQTPFGGFLPTLDATPVTPADLIQTLSNARTDVETEAIFGSIGIDFADSRGTLTIEGRYTWDDKTILNIGPNTTRGINDSFFDPRIILDYQFTDNVLVYASVASGTKAGGINADPVQYANAGGLIPSERTFGADENWTYEIGTKASLWNGQATFEVAAFYIDWSSMQIAALSTPPAGIVIDPTQRPPGIVLNLGDATIKGFEFQGAINPIDELTINFGGSYQDATYNDGVVGVRILPNCDGIVCDASNIGGNRLQRSPSTQLFGGFHYAQPTGFGDAVFNLRGDVAWQNKHFTDESNTAQIPGRTIVNMSIGFEFKDYEVRAWSRNLFDENYVSSALFLPFSNAIYSPFLGQRRSFGLSVAVDY